jgi:hypothetical protein
LRWSWLREVIVSSSVEVDVDTHFVDAANADADTDVRHGTYEIGTRLQIQRSSSAKNPKRQVHGRE